MKLSDEQFEAEFKKQLEAAGIEVISLKAIVPTRHSYTSPRKILEATVKAQNGRTETVQFNYNKLRRQVEGSMGEVNEIS